MSREPKKKPGEAKAQRKRHKARQAVRDALAGLRRGETVYLRALAVGRTITVRVRPFRPDEPYYLQRVVALAGGRIQVGMSIDKDGRNFTNRSNTFILPDVQFYGVVIHDPDIHGPGEEDESGLGEARPVYERLRIAQPAGPPKGPADIARKDAP